jgi:hypothetical protein
VTVGAIKVARWHYLFADNGDGTTTVTESWTEQRPKFAQFIGGNLEAATS